MGSGTYPGTTGKQLSFGQIKQLWLNNGGDPRYADVMAAIAMAESGGQTNVLNNTPATGDYSVGLWQINYYADLYSPRSARFGDPASLAQDPNAQAKAAIALQQAKPGLTDWQGDAAWKTWRAQGAPIPWTNAGELVQGGSSPGTPPPTTSSSSSSSSAGGGGCHAKDKNGTNCAINFPGSFCITYCELKALKSGLLVLAGGALFVVGGLVMVAWGFKRSGAQEALQGVQQFVPSGPARQAITAATRSRQSPAPSATPRRTLRALPDERDEGDELFEATRGSGRQNRSGYRRAMGGPSDTSDLRRRTA